MEALSDDATGATDTSHLQSVWHEFLEYASRALTLYIDADDWKTVRAYTRDVLTKLTRAVPEMFAKDGVPTTEESTYLNDVMRTLGDLDDTRVGEFISDALVPKILDLAEMLKTANRYYSDRRVGRSIQSSARALKANIARVKCYLGTT